jgi:LPS O-antigen subunit length determinant protein (WzzB/FepE family)
VHNLNRFILDYRTRKARNDYEYIDGMCTAARQKYIECQTKHADFVSSHASIHSAIYKKEQQYLENELHLAYSAYSSMVSQLEVARAKLLEATPVYTIIESAYLPIGADSPRKKLMLVLFVFLGCVAATVKVFYKEFYHKK